MKFYKVTVSCTSETSELVACKLNELGSLGEVFDDYNDILYVLNEKNWDYADASLFERNDNCFVSGFFTIESDTSIIENTILQLKNFDFADFSHLTVSTDIIDSVEWENEWKKYYNPFNIGNLLIIPEWIDKKPSAGEIPVYLNPGLAFGTGTHETTSMCIDFLNTLPIKNSHVLDFGCGSGILGICAKALGASSVTFIDTDEQAITATRNNCKLNGINDPTVVLSDVRKISEPADIVLANITADVLIDVEPIILSILRKGGYVVLSGIITEKAESVKSRYSSDFSLIAEQKKNDWSAYVFKL